ncbi:MAG: thioredoxin domain-containing protein [Candidatus Delongbacteria bacterium]
MSTTPTNRLAGAASPYLLQHAHNPVDWWPWGDEAFAEARRRDCPVFLSIGYATCHWCHVMERESFEDAGIAARLNAAFVCVKVDREERPDVDHVYMSVCQSLTGSGGWPLTLLLTPERQPFFAGTYFPPVGRGGRPGLQDLIPRVVELWDGQRGRLLESARAITAELARAGEWEPASGPNATPAAWAGQLRSGLERLKARHDPRHGGFGPAPKFPMPQHLLLLLRAGRRGDGAAGEMARHTLLAMGRGGLQDQLGGGFHRYSTDARWRVPHFEKMLYDQALLALALCQALEDPAGTGDERAELRTSLGRLLEYLRRDLQLPGGGFACGEDADSEGEEGRFYLWGLAELRELLPPDELAVAVPAWQVSEDGNWNDEASGRADPRNILHRVPDAHPLSDSSHELLESARSRLLAARALRVRPQRDDKVLADWNGLAVAALARAAACPAAGEAGMRLEWRRAAEQAARFVLAELDGAAGLRHRWHRGRAGVEGQLDDHAFLIWGLLELAAHAGGGAWLEQALRLQAEQDRLFLDPAGLYRMTRPGGDLPVRPLEVTDGALPCGNSVSAHNLIRLARLLDRDEFLGQAQRLLAALAGRLALDSGGHSWALAACQLLEEAGRRLICVGRPEDPRLAALLESAWAGRGAGLERLTLDPAQAARLTPGVGLLEERPAAWLCDAAGCRPPTEDPRQLQAWLGS